MTRSKAIRQKDVEDTFTRLWNRKLSEIEIAISQGRASLEEGTTLTYPTTLLIGQADGKFIVELTGSSATRQSLRVRRTHPQSVSGYFGGRKSNVATVGITIMGFVLGNTTVANVNNLSLIEERLPGFLATAKTVINAPATHFDDTFANCASFDHPGANLPYVFRCFLIHTIGPHIRLHAINFATVVDRFSNAAQIESVIGGLMSIDETGAPGMNILTTGTTTMQRAAQVMSAYLSDGILEPTITELIGENDFLLKSLGATRVWSQQSLEWKQGKPADHSAIKPDFIIQRLDGSLDLVEFKLPLLSKSTVTTRSESRRGLIDSFSEGISQLAGYSRYFDYEENRRHAEQLLGVPVGPKPWMTLVAGNLENSNLDEIGQAKQQFRDELRILDFDTVLQLFLASEGVLIPTSMRRFER